VALCVNSAQEVDIIRRQACLWRLQAILSKSANLLTTGTAGQTNPITLNLAAILKHRAAKQIDQKNLVLPLPYFIPILLIIDLG
jgi:hypothetical protein